MNKFVHTQERLQVEYSGGLQDTLREVAMENGVYPVVSEPIYDRTEQGVALTHSHTAVVCLCVATWSQDDQEEEEEEEEEKTVVGFLLALAFGRDFRLGSDPIFI